MSTTSPSQMEKADSPPSPTKVNEKSQGKDTSTEKVNRISYDAITSEMDRVDAGGLDVSFERKMFILNKVIQEEVGMGKFQWELFALCGFGWCVDNYVLQGVAIILPEVGKEFSDAVHTPWMTFSLYMGLITGALTWGILADIIGRRISFNATLFIGGIFMIGAGAAPSFVALGGLLAALGFGVGGSLPVDGMLFLEFIPGNKQYLLTLLSVFWAFGQLFASLISWAFIANYTCSGSNSDPSDGLCDTSLNKGWRYTFYTLGACTFVGWIFRFFIFSLPESPKYLISQGRDAEAIAVVRDIAARNGKTIPEDVLSLSLLRAAAGEDSDVSEADVPQAKKGLKGMVAESKNTLTSLRNAMSGKTASGQSLLKPNMNHIRPLFATGKLAYNTMLLIFIWLLVGLAYPLYNAFLPTYLLARAGVTGDTSVSSTYRDYAIISACGVPGSLIAAWSVELPRSGRKGALCFWTVATGAFVFALTGAKSNGAYLALNCIAALVQNAFYGVLYHITPESFPTPARGTGDSLCSSFNRISGSISPLVKIYAPSTSPSAPLFTSGAPFIIAGLSAITLPVDMLGKSSL